MTRQSPIKPLTLAHRTDPFQESVIREMPRLGDEAGAVNLSQGLPDYPAPQEVLDAAVRAILDGDNQYSFPFGHLAFREAVAAKYRRDNGIQADPETEVTVTCGVSEAMMSVILALTDHGDEIILMEPWYENYLPDALMAGVTPRFVQLHQPDFHLDPAELRAAFTPRTRLIILNTPHNPTGKVFNQAELESIAALCQEYGVIAVTDEIYEHIIYPGHRHICLGSLPGMEDRTVTISGLGKTYALTGWRVAWAIAPARLSERIRKVHDYLTICAPSPLQTAGITALSLPDAFYADLREEYGQRRTLLLEALEAAGFRFQPPQGAYYVMADFSGIEWQRNPAWPASWSLDRAFSEYMARNIGVAVVPGSSFFTERKELGYTLVRFNFAKQMETLQEAASRLSRLETNRG